MEKLNGALFWKVEKVISKGDYNYVLVKNHPNATKNGYVLEHRIVVENHLGRLLTKNEIVHHINENKKDNRIENLQLMSQSEHNTLHSKGRSMVKLICPNCRIQFDREKRLTHLSRSTGYTCCSNKCRGKFSRYIHLHGKTKQVEIAISVNILSEYNSLDNTKETFL